MAKISGFLLARFWVRGGTGHVHAYGASDARSGFQLCRGLSSIDGSLHFVLSLFETRF